MLISCLCKSEISYEVYGGNRKEDNCKEDMEALVPSPIGSQKQVEYSEWPNPIEEEKRKTERKEVRYSACFKNGPLPHVTLGVIQPLQVVGAPIGFIKLRQDLDQHCSEITKNSSNDVNIKEGKRKAQKFRDYLSKRHS